MATPGVSYGAGISGRKGAIFEFKKALFQGKLLHSEQFGHPTNYRGQTVCVVGLGNSGMEIATELAYSAKQVRMVFWWKILFYGIFLNIYI